MLRLGSLPWLTEHAGAFASGRAGGKVDRYLPALRPDTAERIERCHDGQIPMKPRQQRLSFATHVWRWIGRALQALPEFRTKGRWEWMWYRRRDQTRVERRRLPGGAFIDCHLADHYESWIWMRLHDSRQLHILRTLLRPGETFVDAGAHIGVWSLEAGAAVGRQGTVIAFEPNPFTYAKLLHNLALNENLARWRPFAAGLSAQSGSANLELDILSDCCRIVATPTETTSQVRTVALDAILGGELCQGLKIDVEGHELSVLHGAMTTLHLHHPWLCVEFNNNILQLSQLADWPVHRMLTDMGYHGWLFEDAIEATTKKIVSPEFNTDSYVNLYYQWRAADR
jgi:FkbM family methyltransferase